MEGASNLFNKKFMISVEEMPAKRAIEKLQNTVVNLKSN